MHLDVGLSMWLIFVGVTRYFAVILAYVPSLNKQLWEKLYAGPGARRDKSGESLALRTFGVWTAVTGTASLAAGFHPTNVPLLALTAVTFALALIYFLLELLLHKTVVLSTALTPSEFGFDSALSFSCFCVLIYIFFCAFVVCFASVSLLWILIEIQRLGW